MDNTDYDNPQKQAYPQVMPQQSPYQMDDPFTGVSTNSLPPNIPMPGDGPQMMEALLSDDHVSKRLRRSFFWVFGRDNALTFLDDDRKNSKIISFDILKIDTLNNTPYYEYTFGEELKWNIMRNIFETKLDRARGIDNQGTKNERTVQQSQFTENRNIQQQEYNDTLKKDTFIRRLLGRR